MLCNSVSFHFLIFVCHLPPKKRQAALFSVTQMCKSFFHSAPTWRTNSGPSCVPSNLLIRCYKCRKAMSTLFMLSKKKKEEENNSFALRTRKCHKSPWRDSFFGTTRVWTQGLLKDMCFTTWSVPPDLFALVVLRWWLAPFPQADLDHDPPTYASHVAGMTDECATTPDFFLEMEPH
jgi:hypothetical protein